MADYNHYEHFSAPKSINEPLLNLDYDFFINSTTKKYQPSPLRAMAGKFSSLSEGMHNLSSGSPNVATFPFQNISVSLKNGSSLVLEGESLNEALLYGCSNGHSGLRNWLRQFQDQIHGPVSWKNYNVILSSGSQEALSIVASTILEPNDAIIMQTPAYPGTLSVLTPKSIEMIPLHMDIEGIKIERLSQLLKKRYISGKSMPKLIMVNPTGGNPSGVTISEKEKKEIYELACKYNFLIVEDDPYYFLSFSEQNIKSFLSMDSENRVVRLDSFSKIVSAGLRLGFVTGPIKILEKMVLHIESSSIHPSNVSQLIIYEFLKRCKYEDFMQYISEIKMFYQRNRDIMIQAIETHLKGLVDYTIPSAGFFIWLRLKFIRDSKHFAQKRCMKNLILVTPGFVFYEQDDKISPYIRLSYSMIESNQIDGVISKLATLILEEMADRKQTDDVIHIPKSTNGVTSAGHVRHSMHNYPDFKISVPDQLEFGKVAGQEL